MLVVKYTDILRSTLPLNSGNEGWIGVSPTGDDYHVVVPVDVQIARGVMACNMPSDGTPFGGYSGWLYFRCSPYECEKHESHDARLGQVHRNVLALMRFLKGYGIDSEISGESGEGMSDTVRSLRHVEAEDGLPGKNSFCDGAKTIVCSECQGQWSGVPEFVGDENVEMIGYRAVPEDFRKGYYAFSHHCGNTIHISVDRFSRPRFAGRSLAGSHACPGLCYYEDSLSECFAECEGSTYRRIAGKLMSARNSRNRGATNDEVKR